jgi:hypothetical protein
MPRTTKQRKEKEWKG